VKTTIYSAAALLLSVHCASVLADDDKDRYNRRAAQTDMSLFRELDRSGNGLLTRENIKGDMRLGTRFDDIDTNRDGIATQQEMRIYIQQTYGLLPAPESGEPRVGAIRSGK
jgi:hypothetical protein